ncbi:hypothetical protein E2320_004857 [Naja naja]|nr:hypothetical protein E2320_004857 [Naja naja]
MPPSDPRALSPGSSVTANAPLLPCPTIPFVLKCCNMLIIHLKELPLVQSGTPQNMGLIQIVKGCVVKILHHCILGCLKNEDQMDFMDENNLIKRLCSQISIHKLYG